MRAFARISFSEWLGESPESAATAVSRFASAARLLPSVFRTPMVAHALSTRLPAPAGLHHLVARLRGRLTVVNPVGAARLPTSLAVALRSVARDALAGGAMEPDSSDVGGGAFHPDGVSARRIRGAADVRRERGRRLANELLAALPASVRARVHEGTERVAVALYEHVRPQVRIDVGGAAIDDRDRVAQATVTLEYRIALVLAGSEVPSWSVIDAAVAATPAVGWPPATQPSPWFAGEMLVTDTWLADAADAETLARWAHVTGRAGVRDDYWFPESWERFLDGGPPLGCVSAADVWRGRRGRLANAPIDDGTEPMWRTPIMASVTPDVERGVCVPPGYALARCVGTLGVTIVTL